MTENDFFNQEPQPNSDFTTPEIPAPESIISTSTMFDAATPEATVAETAVPYIQQPQPVPVYNPLNPPEPVKKPKNKVLVPIIITLCILVLAAAAILVFMLFSSPKTKVMAGIAATFSSADNSISDYINLDTLLEATADANQQSLSLSLDDIYIPYSDIDSDYLSGVALDVNTAIDKSNKEFSSQVDFMYAGTKLISAELFAYDNTLALSAPEFFEGYLEIPLSDMKSTYKNSIFYDYMEELIESGIDIELFPDSDDDTIAGEFGEEFAADIAALSKAITVEKKDSKTLTVGGKDVNCKGYTVILPKKELKACIGSYFAVLKESFNAAASSTSYLFDDDIWDEAESIYMDGITKDIKITIYLDNKGRMVKASHKGTYGDYSVSLDFTWQGKEYLFDDFTGTIDFTDEYDDTESMVISNYTTRSKGMVTTDSELSFIDYYGDEVMTMGFYSDFDTKNGYLDSFFNMTDGYYVDFYIDLIGTFSSTKSGKNLAFDIETLAFSEYYSDFIISLSGEYGISPLNNGVESPSGTVYNIATMTEEDFEDFIYDFQEKFMNSTLGSMLY